MTGSRFRDHLFVLVTGVAAAITLLTLVAVLGAILSRGATAVSWSFLTEESRAAGSEGGILFQLLGTGILIATAAAVAVPVACGAGLFLVTYSPGNRLSRVVETTLQTLNGVPSIVIGLFGLGFFFHLLGMKKSWLSGGLLLGIMILPTVAVAFTEKLRAIPAPNIEAAFGLGLNRAQVVRSVLLPQAGSGLVTGTLLGLARAAGETAPIMFTATIFSGAALPRGIVDSPVLSLSYHIFVLAQDSFDVAAAQNVWGAAAVLMMVVLSLSALALPFRLAIHEEARRAR